MSLYSPYWMINKTGKTLYYKVALLVCTVTVYLKVELLLCTVTLYYKVGF